ncbi:MAG TPA: M28 family peptidase [Polyangiales bacterium]|nr:M28 family peptidase [Polyangiales bacterium]
MALVVALIGGAAAFMTAMPGRSYRGALPPLRAAEAACSQRLRADIAALSVTIGERRVGLGRSLRAAADLLFLRLEAIQRLAEPGRARLRRERLAQNNADNLVLDLAGRSTGPLVLIGAHYDSAPGTPGANDNASGVALALELAAHFAAQPTQHPLRFVLFANEEPPFFDSGTMGSDTHAARARARGERIRLMLSLETLGYYSDAPGSQRYPWPLSLVYPDRGNFVGFVANLGSAGELRDVVRTFRAHAQFPSEAAALPEALPGVSWSDHASFWRRGYAAIMVTDTAPFRYPFYHTPKDELARLDVQRLARVATGLRAVIERLAAAP